MVGNKVVKPSKAIKYLGIWLDDKLIYNEHVRQTCNKARRQVSAITRILPNMRGLGIMGRRMLAGVVTSILLYAAPIWSGVILVKKYKKMLLFTQRKTLIRVTRAYRTASLEALAVIAGTPRCTYW